MRNMIEILPVSLLESESSRVKELKKLASSLKLEFGWHYLLDITWILRQLEEIESKSIIDAGAGTGVMQWYLAENGARVISIDRESRAELHPRFRRRIKVQGLRATDLISDDASKRVLEGINRRSLKMQTADFIDLLKYQVTQLSNSEADSKSGQVIIYNQDLVNLEDIADDSIDAIVAVSSLEHNSPDGLERVVAELMRVLKPGCALLATLGATRDSDWYHESSKGWCYSEETVRKIFHISNEVPSNYDHYDQLFYELQGSKELRENLASFYFRSGDNGMPWGKWAPEYQPVGICKIKGDL
jgi:SAM-dependent methyltransferase